ncbi:hypothetical protein [Streptomyces sp. NBC_00158]|uniref:hypothetical protein n=1 Tax=Streptomyces sp. NBC_00158 TaxID=2903627 RepID=UPI002F91A3DE
MPLCDYFSAADDQTAVAVLLAPGGPGEGGLDVVCLKNLDPVVTMARLEAVMTGCGYDEACERPRAGEVLSEPEDGPPFVVALTDTLSHALAHASKEELARCAEAWSRTDELRRFGLGGEVTADVLEALAGLARRALPAGRRLYCWWAL